MDAWIETLLSIGTYMLIAGAVSVAIILLRKITKS